MLISILYSASQGIHLQTVSVQVWGTVVTSTVRSNPSLSITSQSTQNPRVIGVGSKHFVSNFFFWMHMSLHESNKPVYCLLVQSISYIQQFCTPFADGSVLGLAGTITKLSIILFLIFWKATASGYRIKPSILFWIMIEKMDISSP